MNEKREYHMNIGGASIILVMVVLALTVFAILSVRASYHERKLAQKTREYIENYYRADAEAEVVYKELTETFWTLKNDDILEANCIEIANNSEYKRYIKEPVFEDNLTFVLEADYNTSIEVCLSLENDVSESYLTVKSWRMKVTDESEDIIDEPFLWDGVILD